MLTLSVIGVEDGAIIAAAPNGERFRLPVDADLRARLQEEPPAAVGPRLSPRDPVARARRPQRAAGRGPHRSPRRLHRALRRPGDRGARVHHRDRPRGATAPGDRGRPSEDLRRGDGRAARRPGRDRRAVDEHARDERLDRRPHLHRGRDRPRRALAVRSEADAAHPGERRGGHPVPAGHAGRAHPAAAGARADGADHRRAAGRAADVPQPVASPSPDTSRFDSAIFAFPDLRTPEQRAAETPPQRSTRSAPTRLIPEQFPDPRFTEAQTDDRAPEQRRPRHTGPTTDQLASLSRRRGEREPSIDTASLPVTRAMSVIDTEDEDDDPFARRPPKERDTTAPVTRGRFPERLPEATEPAPQPAPRSEAPMKRPRSRSGTRGSAPRQMDETGPVEGTPATRPRRGRTTMPSWDEIVFGRDED